jgi:F-type H+-transporting ATPase subunit gamma
MKDWTEQGLGISCTAIGTKGLQFLNRIKAKLVSHVTHIGDNPRFDDLVGEIKVQLDAFTNGEIDEVYIAYNRFINTMRQEPIIEKLLPLPAKLPKESGLERSDSGWDYIYEPDAQTVIDELLKRYIEALVYQSVAENMASEQSARMVAMKAASDNAKNVIGELQLVYNKTRQAAITKELSEIVSGAAAV